ncbi:MAG TPA: TIM barrel protein [Thermoguttaceae bacterium]|nr:TIM barrel protein [Thermoguttaceae bacterium]
MQRRDFIQTTGAGLAALLARPAWALSVNSPYLKTLGLQLYTLRNQLAEDVAGTIKAVADAGYHQVELMRVVGDEPIFRAARDHGLQVTSAMIDWKTLISPGEPDVPSFQETLDVAVKQKLKYLVIPYVGKGHRETADQLKVLARRANRAGEACRKAGIQLCYHHHSFEFAKLPDGMRGWDILVEQFDPALVKFEIDVFWAAIGGLDPVATIRGLKGRVAQLHLKDLLKGTPTNHDESTVPKEAFQEVGDGIVDWPAVLAAGQFAGVVQCHVEQDQSPDAIASIGQSIRHLKSLP